MWCCVAYIYQRNINTDLSFFCALWYLDGMTTLLLWWLYLWGVWSGDRPAGWHFGPAPPVCARRICAAVSLSLTGSVLSVQCKVLVGDDRDSVGCLMSLDGLEGVVKLEVGNAIRLYPLRNLCKLTQQKAVVGHRAWPSVYPLCVCLREMASVLAKASIDSIDLVWMRPDCWHISVAVHIAALSHGKDGVSVHFECHLWLFKTFTCR